LKTICILTQSHLSNNPRVLKEALTLAKNGYAVRVITNIYSQELLEQDLLAIGDLPINLLFVSDISKRDYQALQDRFLNKLGQLLIKYFRIETSLALGYGALRYLKRSSAVKADVYICHQELATYIGCRLIEKGFKVAFDLEDWYSEDLLEEARRKRPISLLRKIEAQALREGIYSTTTSTALAKKLAQVYSCKLPGTIYNVFPSNNVLLEKLKQFKAPLKLLWFSQTVGPGRGIEEFISLSRSIKYPVELHLLGNVDPTYREALKTLMPECHHLFFHKPVSSLQLPKKIGEFDIGLALEMTTTGSRNCTITNKFFQYLQSGLPLIASETAGQQEGFDRFKPGFFLSQMPSNEQITELNNWLSDPAALSGARDRAIQAAKFFNWEKESQKLIQLVNQVFENAG
jgi:glycosyltransferase involved in cell wall biosynthesis